MGSELTLVVEMSPMVVATQFLNIYIHVSHAVGGRYHLPSPTREGPKSSRASQLPEQMDVWNFACLGVPHSQSISIFFFIGSEPDRTLENAINCEEYKLNVGYYVFLQASIKILFALYLKVCYHHSFCQKENVNVLKL